ncbi:alpha-2Db adrenergic receptor-like [Emys orbicularis]|uniref:alpha-2Db adrenergic receptor-like n=1 Tax=Emys orbicularis TaxID=82168 RepID=UPI0031FD3956
MEGPAWPGNVAGMEKASAPAAPLNASGNDSRGQPGAAPHSPLASALILLAVLSIILATLLGNALVVVAVFISRALKAPQNLFLVSLASADILVATLIIPFSLANELLGSWGFGSLWCSLYLALDVLFCTSSILHLCAISLDRYWAVTRATRFNLQRSPGRVKVTIGAVWAIAGLVSVPALFTAQPQARECLLNKNTWYVLASCTASFFAPCLIMLAVYCRIYRITKHRCSGIVSARPGMAQRPSCASSCLPTATWSSAEQDTSTKQGSQYAHKLGSARLCRQWPEEENNGASASPRRLRRPSWALARGPQRWSEQQSMSISRRRLVHARERRFTFVLAVVISAFVLCWFPFFFTYSLESLCGDRCHISKRLFSFFFWIGYCNSCLNPVIYTVFNRHFRRAFRRLLSKAPRCHHPGLDPGTAPPLGQSPARPLRHCPLLG